ncbi:MAG: ferritin family protein [Candidatus Omnitrophota bacterium]|nr:ferritin family protein [Candidatus Omnitrophota bacterium]
MDNKFSGCEIVEMAVQIEKNGKDFYTVLSDITNSPDVGGIFDYLAGAEEKHMEIFRGIFDGACGYEPAEAYPGEYFAYIKALAGQYVFTVKDKGKELGKSVKSLEEGIELAIGFEKDSILFYEEVKKNVPKGSEGMVEGIITEEKAHLRQLLGLVKRAE